MRRRQRRRHLAHERQRFGRRHRAAPDALRQRLAVEQLHRQEGDALAARTIAVPRSKARQTLACVTRRASGTSRLSRAIALSSSASTERDRLERHALAELEVVGLVDLAHAALRDEADDAVAVGHEHAGAEGGAARLHRLPDDGAERRGHRRQPQPAGVAAIEVRLHRRERGAQATFVERDHFVDRQALPRRVGHAAHASVPPVDAERAPPARPRRLADGRRVRLRVGGAPGPPRAARRAAHRFGISPAAARSATSRRWPRSSRRCCRRWPRSSRAWTPRPRSPTRCARRCASGSRGPPRAAAAHRRLRGPRAARRVGARRGDARRHRSAPRRRRRGAAVGGAGDRARAQPRGAARAHPLPGAVRGRAARGAGGARS